MAFALLSFEISLRRLASLLGFGRLYIICNIYWLYVRMQGEGFFSAQFDVSEG